MSENVVAVRSIEIVTAEITMIRDNARKVFLESVIQIGSRLEEAKLRLDEYLLGAVRTIEELDEVMKPFGAYSPSGVIVW